MKTVVTLTVIVALALGGTSATVSAAQNSLPEEALYAVKLASEAARLRLASDPQTQVNLLMEMAQTRTREMARMAELGKPVPPSVALRLEAHLRLALQTAAQLDETEMRAALKQLRQMAQAQTETLARVRQRHPEEAGLELAERVMTQMHDQAQSGLNEPALFRRQWQSGRPDDPPTQPAGAPNPSATPFSDQSPYRHDNGNDPAPNLTPLPGGHSYGPGPQITGTCTPQLDGNSYGPGPGTFSVTPTGDHNSYGPGPNPMPTPEGNHNGPPAGATPQPENTPPAGGPGGKP